MYGNNRVLKNDCVIHKCRTLTIARRQKVYTTLLIRILQTLNNKGINQVFIGAKDFNTASSATIEKVGFKLIEKFNSGNFFVRLINHIKGLGTKVITYD